MNARTVRELPQHRTNSLDQRLNIKRMVVKMIDRVLWRAAGGISIHPAPFLQAAECRGIRVVGIKRQKHDFIQWASPAQSFDRLARERMPVAHGSNGYGIDVRR